MAAHPNLPRRQSVIQFVSATQQSEDVRALKEIFSAADKERQGSINASQLRIVLKEFGVQAGEEETQLLFEGMDVNNDGKISFDEFTAGITWLKKSMVFRAPTEAPPPAAASSTKPALRRKMSIADIASNASPAQLDYYKQLFGLMDDTKKGAIDRNQFVAVFKELDLSATEAEVQELFKQLDVNGDGAISLTEFVAGMQRLNKAMVATNKLSESAKKLPPMEDTSAENCNLLKRYIKENFVERAVKKAQEAIEHKDYATAKAILELLDMPRIEKLEEYVGTLTTSQINEQYESCRQAVVRSLKQP